VSFGDLASKVLFASASSSFREFVFTKCSCSWEDIDFGKISKTQAENLTDTALHLLLTNMKAVQVSTTRSIIGCTSIQGRGLSALLLFSLLEKVELRKTREEIETIGDTGLDDTVVTGILSSMAPINENLRPFSRKGGFKLVKIRKQLELENFYDCYNYENRTFLSTLNDSVAR
jgi:hypothetical protein